MSGQEKFCYEFGPFYLDTTRQLLLRGGEPVPLAPRVYKLLLVLVQHSGRVVGREELFNSVWEGAIVEDSNITVNISTLRRALGKTHDAQEYIETVPRTGYRFTVAVRRVACRQKSFDNGGASAHRDITSLAVLPLANASNDPALEYLAEGITESIINILSQLPQLRVVARSTAFRYREGDFDPQEVGRELGVDFVLAGRILQFSDRLIIRVELVEAADGWQLWGEQYNSEPSDIFVVQEEISREISEKLRLKLSGEQLERLTKRDTESFDAYQTYLKGRKYLNQRTVGGMKTAMKFFEEAIRKDSDYALAYAGLADSYLLLGSVEYGALDPTEAMQRAERAATRALAIDTTLAEAHASLAYVRIFERDWDGAEKAYRRAIELNPSCATAYHWYGLYLTAMGRAEEGLAPLMHARKLDPLSLPINVGVGFYSYLTGDYARAVEEYRKALEIEPLFYMAHFGLGMAYEQSRQFDAAFAAYQRAIELSDRSPLVLAGLSHAYAAAGRRDDALRIVEELSYLKEQLGEKHVSPYFMAAIRAEMEDYQLAFEFLHQACDMRSEGLFWIKVDPSLKKLHGDSRFAEVLRRLALA